MKNWKTTLVGVLGAIATIVVPMVTGGGAIDWKSVATAAGLAAVGYFSKDSNVTGGTVQQ